MLVKDYYERDHGSIYYDEVNVMKNYAMERNVPSEDIFMDHADFLL